MNDKKQKALINYLIASKQHREAEAIIQDDEFIDMQPVYKTIDELKEYYSSQEIDNIIINSVELAEKYL